MNLLKFILSVFFVIYFSNNVLAFTDREGKGAQSDGREDSSFLEVKNSNFKKGKEALRQALKLEKKNKLDKAKKKFEKSLNYFVLANKENIDNIEILYFLGFVYNKVDDVFMSEIYYNEGLKIDPNNIFINSKLGELYVKTNRVDLAKERLKLLNSCNCEEYSILKSLILNTN